MFSRQIVKLRIVRSEEEIIDRFVPALATFVRDARQRKSRTSQMQSLRLGQTLPVSYHGPLARFTTAAGYLPAGESIPLFLLRVHPHLESVPHLHSPVFRSLSSPYVDDGALLLLHLNDAMRARAAPYIYIYSSFHVERVCGTRRVLRGEKEITRIRLIASSYGRALFIFACAF